MTALKKMQKRKRFHVQTIVVFHQFTWVNTDDCNDQDGSVEPYQPSQIALSII